MPRNLMPCGRLDGLADSLLTTSRWYSWPAVRTAAVYRAPVDTPGSAAQRSADKEFRADRHSNQAKDHI
jgi:hypothetical protein